MVPMNMVSMNVAVLGLGRLGSVLAKRLSSVGYSLALSDKDNERNSVFANHSGIVVYENAKEAVSAADIVVIAVKPQHVGELAKAIMPSLKADTLVLSMAAGVSMRHLHEMFPEHEVFRAMPNLASAVGKGITALVGDAPESLVAMLQVFGEVVPLAESQMHVFTAAAGSGPGFICRLLDEAVRGVVSSMPELRAEALEQWLLTMIEGTVCVLREQGMSLKALEESVAAPNGTTLSGLNAGQGDVFDLTKAIVAAAKRSEAIAEEIEPIL